MLITALLRGEHRVRGLVRAGGEARLPAGCRPIREALTAATRAGVEHFVYVSVAQPAPVMRAYVEARASAEALIRASGLNATILRPWYVLGPGHRWPVALLPVYWVLGALPPARDGARRLGLVTIGQMIAALAAAVEAAPRGVTIWDVPEIRHRGAAGALTTTPR